jgi:hypothetical protein
MKKHFIFLSFLLVFISCNPGGPQHASQESLEDYYFPIDSLETPKIYRYSINGAIQGEIYWVLSRVEENNKIFMVTESYLKLGNGEMNKYEVIKEEISNTGSEIAEYAVVPPGQEGNAALVNTTLHETSAFKWQPEITSPMVWSFTTRSDGNPVMDTKTVRSRVYTGEKSTFMFNGKKTDAVRFTDNFSVSISNANKKVQEVDFTMSCMYAEGIGLVKREMKDPGQGQVTYTLTEILSPEEWSMLKEAGAR